jgi:hypothetical protein
MKTNFSKMFGEMIGRVLGKGEVRYWPARDLQGRFSHGEAGDPEVKRRKIDAAVREAHRRILDNPNEMNQAAYDAAADQGLSGHDAQEVFQLVDQKMRKEAEALAKGGTSEGAKKGWETRRGGGDSPEDKPSKLMSPQLEDVVRRGYVTDGVVDDPGLTTTEGAKVIIVRKKDGSSASYLTLLPPTKQDPNWTVGSGATAKSERKKGLWNAITNEAAAFAQSQGTSLGSGQIISQENKAYWEKLTSAGKAVRQDEHHYIFVGDAPKPEKADKTLEKAGTSEGAKLGWETRRGGGAKKDENGDGGLSQEDFKGDDASISTSGLMEVVAGKLASQWDVTQEDLKRLAKEEGRDDASVAGMPPEKLKESLVEGLLRIWGGSSGGPVPTAMTTAVADRLGLEYRLDESGKTTNKFIKANPALDRATASLGEAMYSSTQKWLKERGTKSVDLYRKGGLAEDRLFSSWSTSWGGVRQEGGGDYVKVRVPASQVFSTPATGFGTLAESEVVLLPGKREVIARGEKEVSKAFEELSHPRDASGRFASGEGEGKPESAGPSEGKAILDSLKEPITNLDDAIKMLREGKGVMFDRPDHAVVLLDKMAEAVKEAKDKGEKAPVFDLCKVMVKGASLFCHQNMKIPRDQMPQLSGTPKEGTPSDKLPRNKAGHVNVRDALLDSLTAKGVKVEKTEESAGRMRASQNQMDGGKVGEMLKSLEKGTLIPAPLFISKENYVVDGHHGWAATVAMEYKEGKEIKIPVYRVDMPILDLLKYTNDFSEKMGLRQKELGKSLTWALFGGNRVMGAYPMTQEQSLTKAGTFDLFKAEFEEDAHLRDPAGRFATTGEAASPKGKIGRVPYTAKDMADAYVDHFIGLKKAEYDRIKDLPMDALVNAGTLGVAMWRHRMGMEADPRLAFEDKQEIKSFKKRIEKSTKVMDPEAVPFDVRRQVERTVGAIDENPVMRRMMEKFGKPLVLMGTKRFRDGSEPPQAEYMANGVIAVYQTVWSPPSETSSPPEPGQSVTSARGGWASVLRHEYGHHIYRLMPAEKEVRFRDAWNRAKAERDRELDEAESGIGGFEAREKVMAKDISYYAYEKEQEGFAEAFSTVSDSQYDPSKYAGRDRELLDIMSELIA